MSSNDEKLERISSLSEFFNNPIQLNIAHPNKSSNYLYPFQKDNEEKETPQNSVDERKDAKANVPAEAKKQKHTRKKRNEIDPNCKVFFALVKPRGTVKGTRVLFLYAPPLYALFNHKEEELEMIPTSTKIYLEGRFLILVNNGNERAFSLKVDEKRFSELVSNQSNDILLQFCYFCQVNHYLLPPVFLTNPFYNQVVNQDRFYVALSHFPVESFSQKLLDHYVRAVDPLMDTVLERLVDDFLDPIEVDISTAPRNKFVFNFILNVLNLDDAFNNLKTAVEKSKRPQETFILAIESMQFNDRTKMVLHILYSRTEKHFPNMNTAGKLTASIILRSIIDYLLLKNLSSKVEAMQSLDGFQPGNLSPTMYRRYVNSLKAFANQPPFYQLTKKGTFSFESFVELLQFVWTNINKFVQILEKYPYYN